MLTTADNIFCANPYDSGMGAMRSYDALEGDIVRGSGGAAEGGHPYWMLSAGLASFEAEQTTRQIWFATSDALFIEAIFLLGRQSPASVQVPAPRRYVRLLVLSDATGAAPAVGSELDDAASASQLRSPLVSQVRSAFSAWADLPAEPDEARTAEAARDDAITLLDRDRLPGKATVEINDDGIFSIEWEREGFGVLLVFSGDGTASYSRRDTVGFYSSHVVEFAIGGGLPRGAKVVIESLSG